MFACLRVIAYLLLPLSAFAQSAPSEIVRYSDLQHPVLGPAGMVAAQNRQSAEVGAAVLADGGNAIDAAIATGFSLAVTLPRAGNLGGGGFMLVHLADEDTNTAIDYREMAPQSATRDMYLDRDEVVDSDRSRYTHLASGVPGTVSGFYHAHKEMGQLPWERLLQPAIDQARNGIVVSYDLAEILRARRSSLCRNKAACGYFYKPGGVPYEPGEILVQADLADTLELIAEQGPDAFYRGKVAKLIAEEMRRGGGLVDEASLAAYVPTVREPVVGSYRGNKIVTMPPPSSGGVHILQMLNILENFPIEELGAGSADNIHLLVESARLAFADRSKHLGDPDYYVVPVEWLTSKAYAKSLAAEIDMQRARKSADVAPGREPAYESEDTTHFSVIDADGNIVSNTYTLNFSFGSGIAVPGAGFLLNNEMDDFSAKPGTPNGYGLIGGEANAVAAGKRPLSSMTPTIVFAEDGSVFATGSPGGSRIITTVLQMLVNVMDHKMNLAEATHAPRVHHQWLPDVVQMESGFSPDTVGLLKSRGHTIVGTDYTMGSLQSVGFDNGVFLGASDPRRPNAGSVAAQPD